MTEPPSTQPSPRRVRRSSADRQAHAVLSDPTDPRIGEKLGPAGASQVTLQDGTEYELDPETGIAVTRV